MRCRRSSPRNRPPKSALQQVRAQRQDLRFREAHRSHIRHLHERTLEELVIREPDDEVRRRPRPIAAHACLGQFGQANREVDVSAWIVRRLTLAPGFATNARIHRAAEVETVTEAVRGRESRRDPKKPAPQLRCGGRADTEHQYEHENEPVTMPHGCEPEYYHTLAGFDS